MCQPFALRLRGTFIDLCPDHSDIEGSFGYGSKVRSCSSPPGFRMAEQTTATFEHCSIEYLKGLVSRVEKLSSSAQSPSKEKVDHPEKSLPTSKLSFGAGVAPPSKLDGQVSTANEPAAVTTLMMRNIPCKMTLKAMIDLFDSHGFAGTYDFLHLPGRGRPFSNLGYAFINFSNTDMVGPFTDKFHGVEFASISGINTEKVIEIRPARAQGFAQNIAKVRHIMSSNDDNSLYVVTHGAPYLL
mmetsp:Transcript_123829/g.214680  ORF Transcript_123829/g.214680 Transcript_123829/m.214680 type:complete len:242 (-) Transcript_123829:150-875(-)